MVDPGLRSAKQAVTGDIRGAASTALGAAATATKEGAGDYYLQMFILMFFLYVSANTTNKTHITTLQSLSITLSPLTGLLSTAASAVKITTMESAGKTYICGIVLSHALFVISNYIDVWITTHRRCCE